MTLCTHVNCSAEGIGKTGPTASHWLCQPHLDALNAIIAKAIETGDPDDTKRMVGMTIRAAGGAQAMAERMSASITTGAAALFEALRAKTPEPKS